MGALRAGQRGRKVLVLDQAEKVGSKILVSGGGRCNFTNLNIAPERYISQNPRFCLSALRSYTQHDFIGLVDKHKIPYHEKTLGQLFCDGSAQDIVAMLLAECADSGVEIRLGQHITGVSKTDVFRVQIEGGEIEAQAVVLATGGLSIPKMGATGFSHRIAQQFGLPLVETRPGLVPLCLRARPPPSSRNSQPPSTKPCASPRCRAHLHCKESSRWAIHLLPSQRL